MPLPKNLRIKREKDFEKIFKTGQSFRHPFFLLKFLRSPLSYCRAAISVPLAVSKEATTRNKLKRIFWAALGEIVPRCRPGFDLVLVVSPMAKEKKINQISQSLEEIFLKANIVQAN